MILLKNYKDYTNNITKAIIMSTELKVNSEDWVKYCDSKNLDKSLKEIQNLNYEDWIKYCSSISQNNNITIIDSEDVKARLEFEKLASKIFDENQNDPRTKPDLKKCLECGEFRKLFDDNLCDECSPLDDDDGEDDCLCDLETGFRSFDCPKGVE